MAPQVRTPISSVLRQARLVADAASSVKRVQTSNRGASTLTELARVKTAPRPVGCHVELFGTARVGTGIRDLVVPLAGPTTIRELVAILLAACPELGNAVLDGERGTVKSGYLLNRNGRDFLLGPDASVSPGDNLL